VIDMPTLADDLLLLLLDADTGLPRVERTKLDYALGGAILLELALHRRVNVSPGAPPRAAVTVLDTSPMGDDVLDDAIQRTDSRPSRADKLAPALSKGLRTRLLARAVRDGRLRHEQDRLLGLFRRDRWPATDLGPRQELAGRLHDILVVAATPDTRAAALVALLSSIDAAHVAVNVHDRATRAAVRRRAAEVDQGEWAADAVRRAVQALQAAVAAGATAAVTATTVASS
jgi:Golgi phosphoprotein 3 (GPP34)